MRVCAIFTSMILAGSLATAQESGLQAMRTGDDGRGWEAVGLLKVDSKGFCTGALIEPDLVLTAAHCVMDAATGEYVRPASIEFRAGWRGGRAQSYRLGRRTIVHPDYVVSPNGSRSRIANDVALIELDRPIRDTRTNPFPVGEQPRKGSEVAVVSYAHDRSVDPSIEEGCDVLARQFGVLVLNCDVDFGSSGAPIFRITETGPEIVSVVSAKGDVQGKQVSFGTNLTRQLAHLQDIKAAGGGVYEPERVIPKVRSVRTKSSGGAKFVKVK